MASDRLMTMEIFVRVVESGSFSSVARARSTTQSAISKAVASLEARLGTRLLNRTTRSLAPTPAGLAYYSRCKSLLASIEEAELEARFAQSALHGRLRVNTSAMLAMTLVQPVLLAFGRLHPQVQLELVMDDRRIDPVEQGADVIVRSGALADSTLVARRAGRSAHGLYAAPSYLEHAPALSNVADLEAHSVVMFTDRHSGPARFEAVDTLGATVEITGPIAVSSAVLARDAAVAGAGITILPYFLAAGELASGTLRQVLPQLDLPESIVSLLHPFGRSPPARVSAFIDFAVATWRDDGRLNE